jgi:predicted amidohydrolase
MPPRKIIVGTSMQGFWGEFPGLEKRLADLRGLVEEMAAKAEAAYPGEGLDLVVLPETAITLGRGQKAADRALHFTGKVAETFTALARRFHTYLVVPLDLEEGSGKKVYSNAAVLLDRAGKVVGIYRKVHPVVVINAEDLEGGITPGREFPVFECDFGRVGIQICWDVVFDDGWAELARKGADIVVWPTASPATAQPASRARRHEYYIVSSTPRENASIFEPTGMVAAQVRAPERVLVKQIDLSFSVLPWSSELRNGEAFKERFGDRAGFNYYVAEDLGLFWSNDPKTPIGEMVRQLRLTDFRSHIERNRQVQDAARGGPPSR